MTTGLHGALQRSGPVSEKAPTRSRSGPRRASEPLDPAADRERTARTGGWPVGSGR
jgi:hypothetical protein